jgi:hypothetical protein
MAVETVKLEVVGAHLLSTDTTRDITHSGFGTVKAAIIMVGYGYTQGTVYGNTHHGVILWDGVNDIIRSTTMVLDSNVSTVATLTYASALGISFPYSNNTIHSQWTVSGITDGLRFTKVSSAGHMRFTAMLFGGDGIVDVQAGTLNINNSSSSGSENVGFLPNMVFGTTMADTNLVRADGTMNFGFAGKSNGSIKQRNMSFYSDDNATTEDASYSVSTSSFLKPTADTAEDWALDIDSFSGSSFNWSHDYTGSSLSDLAFYLAIQVDDDRKICINGGNIPASATSFTQVANATLWGEGIGGMVMGMQGPTGKNTMYQSGGCAYWASFWDPSEVQTISFSCEDGVGTTDTSQMRSANNAWKVLNKDGTTWTADTDYVTADGVAEFEFTNISGIPGTNTHLNTWQFCSLLPEIDNVYAGSTAIEAIYVGSTEITAMYEGSTQIY